MKSLTFRVLLMHSLLFLVISSLFAQKHFDLTIQLPQGIDKAKVEVWLENGKGVEKIKTQPTIDGQLQLAGEFYSLYAVVSLQYLQDPSVSEFGNTFFIQEKPAIVTFHPSDSPATPFNNCSLHNVQEFKEERKQIESYAATEGNKLKDYEKDHGDKLFKGTDTAVRNYFFNVLLKDYRRKKLEYIVNNTDSYYSFYTFKTELAGSRVVSSDSLITVFNAFPDKFKYSDEGNYLNEFLHGKLLFDKKGNAVDFTAMDIRKNKITLLDFEGKKYVLLHFWATWCTPCMRELPALREIYNQYKSKDLQIVSIALKSSHYTEYTEAIKKYKMTWIHIYNDLDLYNRYGNFPVPRICLIDKDGKLIYDVIGLGENNDFKLGYLNKVLSETIK